MTKKEERINRRNIEIRELTNISDFDDVIVVENYDPEFAQCYGQMSEIRTEKFGKAYRKIHEIISGNYWQRGSLRLIVKEPDVKYIWKNRYIILKKGGVFDIATGFFIIKKKFLKAKYLWERKVRNHEIWDSYQIQSFNEFGMNLSEYKVHKKIESMLDMFYEDLYTLLESRGFESRYERNEFYFTIIQSNSNGDKFSITEFDTSNPENLKVSFRYNDNEYSDYELDKAISKVEELTEEVKVSYE